MDDLTDTEPPEGQPEDPPPPRPLLEALIAAPDRANIETSDALYLIGAALAAAAGALDERDERVMHYARFRIGDPPAEHGLVGRLDGVLEMLASLPGTEGAALRRRRRAAHAECHGLRGSAYLARTVAILTDAAAAALSLARALPHAEMVERQDLLLIAGSLSLSAHKDAGDYQLYVY